MVVALVERVAIGGVVVKEAVDVDLAEAVRPPAASDRQAVMSGSVPSPGRSGSSQPSAVRTRIDSAPSTVPG